MENTATPVKAVVWYNSGCAMTLLDLKHIVDTAEAYGVADSAKFETTRGNGTYIHAARLFGDT